ARGLDVSANDPAAVAAADDFAARLLRLDQGVEGILEAAKRWPDAPIIQLYAAAFWLYGQTDGARETAATHLRACEALAMNGRERALQRALALGHGNDNLYAVEALEAIPAQQSGSRREARGRSTRSPTFSSARVGCGRVWRGWNHSCHCLRPAVGPSIVTTLGILHYCILSSSTSPRQCACFA